MQCVSDKREWPSGIVTHWARIVHFVVCMWWFGLQGAGGADRRGGAPFPRPPHGGPAHPERGGASNGGATVRGALWMQAIHIEHNSKFNDFYLDDADSRY